MRRDLFSRPFSRTQQLIGKPSPDGDIVDFDTGISHGYGGNENADRDPDMRTERCVGMLRHPVHLHVYHGVMRDIEWIGDHTEKLAYRNCLPSGQGTAGSGGHNSRIYRQDHDNTIEAIEPFMSGAPDMRHYQGSRHRQRAPCHRTPSEIYAALSKAIKQQTPEERIEKPADADIYLVGGQTEPSDHRIPGIFPDSEQTCHVEIHGEIDGKECRECHEHCEAASGLSAI